MMMVFIPRFGGAQFGFSFVDIDDQIAGDPIGGFVGFVFENDASASGEALFDLEGVGGLFADDFGAVTDFAGVFDASPRAAAFVAVHLHLLAYPGG